MSRISCETSNCLQLLGLQRVAVPGTISPTAAIIGSPPSAICTDVVLDTDWMLKLEAGVACNAAGAVSRTSTMMMSATANNKRNPVPMRARETREAFKSGQSPLLTDVGRRACQSLAHTV